MDEKGAGDVQMEIMEAVKTIKLCTIKAVGEANALPMCSEGYELCASFPAFSNFMIEQQRRITTLLREVMRNAGCRAVIPNRIDDLDELLERLVEANDSICERAGILLDLLQKAGRFEEVVVPQHILGAESTIAQEKSLYERQGRYTALLRRLSERKDKSLSSSGSNMAALPLLTAKEKPQAVYGIQVDNSSAEFVPKLIKKHHALKCPTSSLQLTISDDVNTASWLKDQEVDSHPYRRELLHFKIPDRQLIVGLVRPLKALSATELVYVDTLESLENLRDILNKEEEFSVDLEIWLICASEMKILQHNSYRSFLGLTCLMQISTRATDYIIDPFPLWNYMHILNEPFTDPNILKIFHGADSDIAWLQRDFGIYVVNMFDTYKAMRVLNYSKFSYQHLVQMCCNLILDKKMQKADWRLRPLTDAHKQYARSDTHYLLHCYDILRKRLIEEGNGTNSLLERVYSESTELCLIVYEKPVFQSDDYEKLLVGRKSLNSRQQFALEALWKWRDDQARADDESPQYVLPNHMMLQIAEVLPREMQGILACCSPVPVHVKRELHALHCIINIARDQPLVKRQIYAPNISSLTFESITSQLNKMNAIKALLRCHLDFSSTKYNEEIRDIVTQKIEHSAAHQQCTTSNDGMISVDVHVIGETNTENDTKCLTNVLKKIEEWATPFECYRIALMEQKSKAEAENKTNDEKLESLSEEKKLWSHLDPAANKPDINEMKQNLSVSIPTTTHGISESTKNSGGISSKKSRMINWTDASEECSERVDYDAFEPALFKQNSDVSSAYDPFKQEKRGKWKPRHARRMRKECRM